MAGEAANLPRGKRQQTALQGKSSAKEPKAESQQHHSLQPADFAQNAHLIATAAAAYEGSAGETLNVAYLLKRGNVCMCWL